MSRNFSLTILICFLSIGMKAQLNYSYTYYQNGNRHYYSKPESVNKYRKFSDVKVKEVTQTYYRKGKTSFIINYKYNPASCIYEIDSKDKKNRGSLTSLIYENDTLLMSIYQTEKKNDTTESEHFKYNESNKCVEELELIDGKIYHLCKYEWNENGLVKRKENTYSKHKKWNSYTEIDYYDDKTRKEERIYKKGILNHKYVYACSPVGEKVSVSKEESKVCTIKNKNDDGSYYVINEINEGKKGIRRYIQKYNSDSLITTYETYDLKGNLRYKYAYQYDNQKLIKEELYGIHKRHSTDYFIYGADNLLSASYRLNKRCKKIRDYSYVYSKYE
ncbi:MAG: hypothetical protein NTU43_09690 [Bacteroidetes bacterium]|nr:hypothetical protein [Bacteroidota bacterium]